MWSGSPKRWVMKNRLAASSAILSLVLVGALSVSVQAQTTQEGAGPSEQPSAPMEMGQPQATQPPPPGQPPQQPGQPPQLGREAQPGGPSGEGPAKIVK